MSQPIWFNEADPQDDQPKNSFWKDIYASLLLCRRNILTIHLEKFITLPINGEPQITKNNIARNQDWCKFEMINTILNADVKVKRIDEFYGRKNLLVLNYMNFKGL